MEKALYLLLFLSGIRLVFISGCEFYGLFKEYRRFINHGFHPEEMDIVCGCARCQSLTASNEAELLSYKEDEYNSVREESLNEAIDKFFYTIFYTSITILSVIKYLL